MYQHNYTVSKKNWATFLRPITLEILNSSLPNLAQITFCSFWASRHNLFESILENSGAIWRITLTINKKVMKVVNWQWLHPCGSFCHTFDNRSLHFVNWWQTLMMVDRLLNYTPDGKLTVFKSELFGAQSELQVLTLQVSVFLVWEGAPSCCSDH